MNIVSGCESAVSLAKYAGLKNCAIYVVHKIGAGLRLLPVEEQECENLLKLTCRIAYFGDFV